jgi:hypothetical protein
MGLALGKPKGKAGIKMVIWVVVGWNDGIIVRRLFVKHLICCLE